MKLMHILFKNFIIGTLMVRGVQALQWDRLPVELQHIIFNHCSVADLISLSNTNNNFRASVSHFLESEERQESYGKKHRAELHSLYARSFKRAYTPRISVGEFFMREGRHIDTVGRTIVPWAMLVGATVSSALVRNYAIEKNWVGAQEKGLIDLGSSAIIAAGYKGFFLPLYEKTSRVIASRFQKQNLKNVKTIVARVRQKEPRLMQKSFALRQMGLIQCTKVADSLFRNTDILSYKERAARALLAGKECDGDMSDAEQVTVDRLIEPFRNEAILAQLREVIEHSEQIDRELFI